MVVIAQRDEAEGLQGSIASSTNRAEHFGHATHPATLYLKATSTKSPWPRDLASRNRPPVTETV
jgi:hypothetical protein